MPSRRGTCWTRCMASSKSPAICTVTAPHAGERQWVETVGPLGLEVAQRPGRRQAVAVVGDIHQTAAARALERRVLDAGVGGAVGVDAALENGGFHKDEG